MFALRLILLRFLRLLWLMSYMLGTLHSRAQYDRRPEIHLNRGHANVRNEQCAVESSIAFVYQRKHRRTMRGTAKMSAKSGRALPFLATADVAAEFERMSVDFIGSPSVASHTEQIPRPPLECVDVDDVEKIVIELFLSGFVCVCVCVCVLSIEIAIEQRVVFSKQLVSNLSISN